MTQGALAGLAVVELGRQLSAAYCGKLLADLGAEVLKVEPPGCGDAARRSGPFPGDVPHPERSGLFLYLNTNKRGITLDVATPTGRDVLGRLLQRADILLEDLGPAALPALGFDAPHLRQLAPHLIVTSISPFGQTGPYRDYQATDLVSFHMGGYGYHLGGVVDDPTAEPPLKAAGRQAEFVAGVHAALATMGAVLARSRSGHGQRVDVSQQEALLTFVLGVAGYSPQQPKRGRSRSANPETGTVAMLPTRDGYVAISPREEHLWQRWLKLMGQPDWANDRRFQDRASRSRHWADLEPLLAAWTRHRTKDEVFRAAQAERIPAFPVNTVEHLFDLPQLAHRQFFQEVTHPAAGTLRQPTSPYRLSATPWQLRRPAPLLSEHNEEVLCGWLGYSRSDLVKLRQAGIV